MLTIQDDHFQQILQRDTTNLILLGLSAWKEQRISWNPLMSIQKDWIKTSGLRVMTIPSTKL